jgi:hypothetical protein
MPRNKETPTNRMATCGPTTPSVDAGSGAVDAIVMNQPKVVTPLIVSRKLMMLHHR